MPFRRKPTKKRKRTVRPTRTRRITRRVPRRSTMPRTIGFPQTYYTRLQITDTLQLTQGFAGVPAVYQYRLNDLFDPDVTATGHQPKFFDQFAALYSEYKVLNAKITVKFSTSQASNASAAPIVLALIPIDRRDGISSWSNINAATEEPRAVFREIPAYGQVKPTTLTSTYSDKRFFRHNLGRANDSISSSFVTNTPTWGENLNIVTASIDSGSTHPTIWAQVVIDFNCRFNDLKNQNQS